MKIHRHVRWKGSLCVKVEERMGAQKQNTAPTNKDENIEKSSIRRDSDRYEEETDYCEHNDHGSSLSPGNKLQLQGLVYIITQKDTESTLALRVQTIGTRRIRPVELITKIEHNLSAVEAYEIRENTRPKIKEKTFPEQIDHTSLSLITKYRSDKKPNKAINAKL